jgi:hypothetical protein
MITAHESKARKDKADMATQTPTKPEPDQTVEKTIQQLQRGLPRRARDGEGGAEERAPIAEVAGDGGANIADGERRAVAHPDLTVGEIHRLKRLGKAVDELLDKISA